METRACNNQTTHVTRVLGKGCVCHEEVQKMPQIEVNVRCRIRLPDQLLQQMAVCSYVAIRHV